MFEAYDLSAPIPNMVPRRGSRVAKLSRVVSDVLYGIGMPHLARWVYQYGWKQDGWISPMVEFVAQPLKLWAAIQKQACPNKLEEWR